MALLMTWLNQVEQVLLEDGVYSFHIVALRWMLGATGAADAKSEIRKPKSETIIVEFPGDISLVRKFFDYLEANAEDYWNVPQLETADAGDPAEEKRDSPFAAAYEGMTYQDTTDDDTEGAVADGGGPPADLDLEQEAERLGKRLRFLSTVARLWQVAAWRCSRLSQNHSIDPALAQWLETALNHQERLSGLLDSIHDYAVPEPCGSSYSVVKYDRGRSLKGHRLHTAVEPGLDF
jgi:hypothetical protein